MKKNVRRSKKNQEKLYNLLFGGILALMAILFVALIIARAVAPEASDYVITADGHVHAADGTHLGTTEEMFGSDYVVTEDGHVHAPDGTHIGTTEEVLTGETEEEHDHE